MSELAVFKAIGLIHQTGAGRKSLQEPRCWLAGADSAAMDELLSTHKLPEVTKRDLSEDDSFWPGTGLLFHDDPFDLLSDQNAPDDAFLKLLNNMYLADYQSETDEITLISQTRLSELLPVWRSHFSFPYISEWKEAEPYYVDLEGRLSFCGTHAVCKFTDGETVCGDRWCHAEHSWVVDGYCLAFGSSGCALTRFYIFPFRTV